MGLHGNKGTGNRSGCLGLTLQTALGMSKVSWHAALKHWGSGFSFKWTITTLLIQVPMAKTGFCFKNSQYPGIAPKQTAITNKPGCPCLPDSCIPPALKHWGSVHSFLWKRIIPSAHVSKAKFGIFLQNSLYTMVSPRQKLPGQTADSRAGLSVNPGMGCG